jgi:UDP-N-acetylmuramoyl-L-alanyl-D-glutamate--2,6-diaminopimelate ligase
MRILESTVAGLHLKLNDKEAFFRLIGSFNAYNLAAVYGAALELGESSDQVLALLSNLKGADGRFEQIVDTVTGKCGIVDYAHTPDALQNVLDTIQKVKSTGSQIITVIGCGGDRDTTKRPIMAKVACLASDKVVLTSDNPRSEDPETILDEMEAGLDDDLKKKMIRISDRMQAIKTAVMMSNNGDIILVAGKGHENYQEIKGEKFPFDDKKILKALLG